MKLLWGMCGSFCNHAAVFEQLQDMVQRWPITMIVSENTAQLDTRFGPACERMELLETLSTRPVMTTLQEAERTGPIDHFDAMIIAPITATELNKLTLGIYDTPITLAAKALLRNQKPLVLGIASNDFLGLSGVNLLRLKQLRHIFFVPFGQDDYVHKPNSLVSDWKLIEAALCAALEDRQLQPLLLEGKGSQ
ncbi:MAG: dipicolinate synthase subunit B [Holdemania massiliensis]